MSHLAGINSEIGQLTKVMLHRPGKELSRLTVANKDLFLFDDLLWVEEAQREHDSFARTLKKCGSKVVYLEKYLADILSDENIRTPLVRDVLSCQQMELELKNRLTDLVVDLNIYTLTDILFSGLTKGEFLEYKGSLKSLTLHSMEKDDFLIPPLPNLYFQRDPYSVIGNRIVISNMNFPARKREALIGKYIFQYHKEFSDFEVLFGDLPEDRDSGSLEGGDILVISDRLIAIGISQRTSAGAIQALGSRLSQAGVCSSIIALDIPKTRSAMHLDTVFTMIDHDSFTIYRGIYDLLDIWQLDYDPNGKIKRLYQHKDLEKCITNNLNLDKVRFFETGGGDPVQASRDQWNDGANVFAVAPGKVITYGRNTVTNQTLKDAGVEVHEIRGSELGRGRGGPRCMTMPLSRGKAE